jgi:hypothetical protein
VHAGEHTEFADLRCIVMAKPMQSEQQAMLG